MWSVGSIVLKLFWFFLFLVGFAPWYGYWYVFDYVDVLWCGFDCFVFCLFLVFFFFLFFLVMMYLLLLSLLLLLLLFLFFLFLMFLLVNLVLVPGWCWSFGSTVSLLSLPHVMQQEWQNINISNGNKILFCVSKAKMEPKTQTTRARKQKSRKQMTEATKSRKTRPHQNKKKNVKNWNKPKEYPQQHGAQHTFAPENQRDHETWAILVHLWWNPWCNLPQNLLAAQYGSAPENHRKSESNSAPKPLLWLKTPKLLLLMRKNALQYGWMKKLVRCKLVRSRLASARAIGF